MRIVEAFVILLAACGQACVPSPSPAPLPPDASDASTTPCAAACARLASLQCAVGLAPDCVTVLARIDGMRLVRSDAGVALTCAELATSQACP